MSKPEIRSAENLDQDAGKAAARHLPILMVVTRESCPHCDRLKSLVLVPMLMSGEYVDRAIIRELSIEPVQEVRSFDGELVKSDALAERYGVSVVPTVLFLGPDGRELHEPMVGINVVEMYGYYLDKAIDEAALALGVGGDRQG